MILIIPPLRLFYTPAAEKTEPAPTGVSHPEQQVESRNCFTHPWVNYGYE